MVSLKIRHLLGFGSRNGLALRRFIVGRVGRRLAKGSLLVKDTAPLGRLASHSFVVHCTFFPADCRSLSQRQSQSLGLGSGGLRGRRCCGGLRVRSLRVGAHTRESYRFESFRWSGRVVGGNSAVPETKQGSHDQSSGEMTEFDIETAKSSMLHAPCLSSESLVERTRTLLGHVEPSAVSYLQARRTCSLQIVARYLVFASYEREELRDSPFGFDVLLRVVRSSPRCQLGVIQKRISIIDDWCMLVRSKLPSSQSSRSREPFAR